MIADTIAHWITRAAVALGVVALSLPILRVWRSRAALRGRGLGSSRRLLRWPAVLALTAVYLSLGIVLWQPIAADINSDSRAVLSIAGSLFYFPGVALYLWGYRSLGKMFGVSSSSVAELYQDHRLVVDGPYSIVRHPMYLGVLLVALGALLIFRTWAMVMFAPSSCVVIVRARREESLLEAEFGEEWRAYEDRVPAWIPIPRFKSRTVQ